MGAVWLLEASGVIEFPLRALVPLALIGVGVGLVVGSRHGSYPALIVSGVVLTLLLAAGWGDRRPAVWRSVPPPDRVGDRVERPLTASDLLPYRLGTGRLTVDLTALRLRDRTYRVEASVSAGQLIVIVPEGVPMRVDARSGVGNVQIPGDRSTGFGADQRFEAPGYDDVRPRFDLHLRVGVGSIVVRQGERRPVRVESS